MSSTMKVALVGSSAKAKASVIAAGGMLCIKLSSTVAIAIVPSSYDTTSLEIGTSAYTNDEVNLASEWLQNTSDILKDAWNKLSTTDVTKLERALPLSKSGHVSISLLIVNSEEEKHLINYDEQVFVTNQILSALISLCASYPSKKLIFDVSKHFLTIQPSTQVPNVGNIKWPSPISFQDKLYCFYQGTMFNQNKLVYTIYNPTTSSWTIPHTLPGVTISEGPSAVVFNGKLYIFHNGHSSRYEVWYTVFDGSTWTSDALVPNTRITGGPSAIVYDDKLYVFHQGYTNNDNELWYNVTSDGSTWEGDKLVGDTLISGSPSAVVFKDQIYCFYRGAGDQSSKLLVNRLEPTTGVWSGHVQLPYTSSISDGPSAISFDDKLYVFHQSESSGALWFNSSSDGTFWRGDTPLTHMVSTDGLGTTVFQDKLFLFYQGAGSKVQSLYHRSFAAGSLEWENVWADPALEQLGYSTGYAGFEELAASVKTAGAADYGYVICVTKLPLLYNSYGDATRLCIQYPTQDVNSAVVQVFDANGTYDNTAEASTAIPRYTFAHQSAVDNTVPISLYSTGFLFHQGKVGTSGTQLWFSLLDRRTSNWTEMQGPVTSATIGGQGTVLVADSKIYVFYTATSNNAVYYNILDGVEWKGETKVPLESVVVAAGAGPASILYRQMIHVFYPTSLGEFYLTTLNTSTDAWTTPLLLKLQDTEYDSAGNISYQTQMTANMTCPVEFLNYVCNLYNGKVKLPHDSTLLDGRLRINTYNGSGSIKDMQIPNTYLTGKPGAAVYGGKLYVFHQGSKSDGTLWYNVSLDGSNWVGDKKVALEKSLLITNGPACMVLEGKLYCFYQGKGTANAGKVWYNVLEGEETWAGQLILPTASGLSSQHDVLPIGSLSIIWANTPPTIATVVV